MLLLLYVYSYYALLGGRNKHIDCWGKSRFFYIYAYIHDTSWNSHFMPMCVNKCVGRTHDNKTVKHPCFCYGTFFFYYCGVVMAVMVVGVVRLLSGDNLLSTVASKRFGGDGSG